MFQSAPGLIRPGDRKEYDELSSYLQFQSAPGLIRPGDQYV